MDKKMIMLGMIVGSGIGGYAPVLFGAESFSVASIVGGFIGGFLGIWLAFRLTR
jgi:hypothetical protein